MISGIRANKSGFKHVSFTPGLNIILSETTDKSSKKESRNGTGKSSLVDIVHFGLGSNADSGNRLMKKELNDWQFYLDFNYGDASFTVSRKPSDPLRITLTGNSNFNRLYLPSKTEEKEVALRLREACDVFGDVFFALPKKEIKYTPSFRSLISYFVRRFNQDGTIFADPFKQCNEQNEWDKQINNAFLLDLNWEDARKFQLLKDREKSLEAIRKVVLEGTVPELSDDINNIAKLEAEKVTIENNIQELKKRIGSFKVHESYREIEISANDLTRRIHEISNENFSIRQSLSMYNDALASEKEPETEYVELLYKEAEVVMPELIKKKLESLRKFHTDLINNRKNFLLSEIELLKQTINKHEKSIEKLSNERAEKMEILKTHGALAEFNDLNRGYAELVSEAQTLSKRIDESKKFMQGKRVVKIEKVQLQSKATDNYERIREVWEEEINLFNEYSKQLYDSPGHLLVSISDNGFKFDINIQRGSSQGFGYMKILCYDLVIATIWSKKKNSPGFIIHDSTIFDGVDSRQIAYALQLASELSLKYGFQYICCINSDILSTMEFSDGFDVNKYIRLRLNDTESGGLFGFRF